MSGPHDWPTPNGHKIKIFLEEVRLACPILPVQIGRPGSWTTAPM